MVVTTMTVWGEDFFLAQHLWILCTGRAFSMPSSLHFSAILRPTAAAASCTMEGGPSIRSTVASPRRGSASGHAQARLVLPQRNTGRAAAVPPVQPSTC